jgi:hypothetical protein
MAYRVFVGNRFAEKKCRSMLDDSSSMTPEMLAMRWFKRGSFVIVNSEQSAPALASSAP